MKINKIILFCASIASLSICGCKGVNESSSSFSSSSLPDFPKHDFSDYNSLLKDKTFKEGVKVYKRAYSYDVKDSSYFNINYNNPNLTQPKWYSTQWGRADEYELSKGTCSVSQNTYTYQTAARAISINPSYGDFTLFLDSGLEYTSKYGHPKNDEIDKIWSHALIEQSFGHHKFKDFSSLFIKFDYTCNFCTYDGLPLTEEEKAGPHGAGQLFIYLRLQENDSGLNKKIWLGMPLYDSRYNVIPAYHNVDAGHAGATNDTIYANASNEFLPVTSDCGIELGKEYHVEYDLYKIAKDAFAFAESTDPDKYPAASFKGCDFDNMSIFYINIGYECRGAFKISSTFRNFDILALEK